MRCQHVYSVVIFSHRFLDSDCINFKTFAFLAVYWPFWTSLYNTDTQSSTIFFNRSSTMFNNVFKQFAVSSFRIAWLLLCNWNFYFHLWLFYWCQHKLWWLLCLFILFPSLICCSTPTTSGIGRSGKEAKGHMPLPPPPLFCSPPFLSPHWQNAAATTSPPPPPPQQNHCGSTTVVCIYMRDKPYQM